MQGLLCRAQRLDNGEYIEGSYYKSIAGYTREFHSILRGSIEYDGSIAPDSIYEIDPQTLQYQINDEWYSKEKLEDIIAKEF